jgi:hypothetical protein
MLVVGGWVNLARFRLPHGWAEVAEALQYRYAITGFAEPTQRQARS